MDDRYERDIVDVARDYARYGLIHKRRDCPFCTCPMLLVRNAESRSQLIWQCGRCGISKGITMNTPLCYLDIKLFDISIYLWIDNVWPRLAQNIVRDRNQVIKNFQLIRKTCSLFVKTKMLPYIKLPGPVEIDETRLGRQKLSKCTVFARKINRVFGMYCRSTGIPLFYYIPDRKHPTLCKIIRKHLPIGGAIISDTMTSYVRPRSEQSRLDQYGFYHFYINITQHNIHEKYSFVYINNVRRNFLELKRHISAYHRMYVPVEKVDQFIHSYMVRTIMKKERIYECMLKILRDYYNYQLDIYLTKYNDQVRHVPNIVTIDKIDKLLDGKHPDQMGDIKFRFRLGLFLAKPKKDPLTRAFLHGSLMDKAYDFDIPEDISEIPDDTADEIEGKKQNKPHQESRNLYRNDQIRPETVAASDIFAFGRPNSLAINQNQDSSSNMSTGLLNPEFPYNKNKQTLNALLPYTLPGARAPVIPITEQTSRIKQRLDQLQRNDVITNNQGSLKESLKRNMQLVGGMESIGNESIREDLSQYDMGKNADIVDNMMNEAASFNCHDIQAAQISSEVDRGAVLDLDFDIGNRLEESSLIYNSNKQIASK